LDGQAEALAALDRFAKPPQWNLDPATVCDVRSRAVESMRSSLEAFFDGSSSGGPSPQTPLDMIQARVGLAQLYAYRGEMSRSTEHFLKAFDLARSGFPAATLQLHEALGIAYLHQAEMENDVYRSPGDRCLFPIRPGGRPAEAGRYESAIEHLS